VSSTERRRAIQAEASPTSTTAIGVQPFDAVFPADGEHQVTVVGWLMGDDGGVSGWLLCVVEMEVVVVVVAMIVMRRKMVVCVDDAWWL
jgi:hypothetical protein